MVGENKINVKLLTTQLLHDNTLVSKILSHSDDNIYPASCLDCNLIRIFLIS